MNRPDPGLIQQSTVRTTLRVGGPIVFGVGLVLTAIALIDFFSVFNSFSGMPTKFWMAFVGMPLMALGTAMIRAGYLGPASRYVAGEVTPTIRDTLGALGLGSTARCAACGAENERVAKFCSSCGRPLAATCPSCGEANEATARFCDHCGKPLTA